MIGWIIIFNNKYIKIIYDLIYFYYLYTINNNSSKIKKYYKFIKFKI